MHGAVASHAVALDVLIADDTPVVRLVTTHALRGLGHRVEAVANGQEAVAAVAARRFDVVLMDIEMPVMNGLAATRAIRALPGAAASVRILALTAEQSDATATACREAGMEAVLWKPIRAADLAAALGRAGGPPPGSA
jgi:CheY-like chemotaxis protein